MNYEIDFSIPRFGVNTLGKMGIRMLVEACGGEQMFINQVSKAQKDGLIDRRTADCCKAKVRTVSNMEYGGKYKTLKIQGVGYVPIEIGYGHNESPVEFRVWSAMIYRCYSTTDRLYRLYGDCEVCENWKYYDKFEEWYKKQVGCNLGYETDKDLLGNGKLYSPETCCLLPRELNRMISDRKTKNRELPTGVKRSGKRFYAQAVIGTAEKKYIYLGNFDTQKEASDAYKAFRKKRIAETAQFYYDKGELDERAYNALINFDA